MAIRRTLDLAELFSTYENADTSKSLIEVSYEHEDGHYQSFCLGVNDLLDMYFNTYGNITSSLVSFDGNGGSGEMPSQNVQLNEQFVVPQCQFRYDKHNFVNWRVQIGFNSFYFQPNDILVVPNQDITLIAQWQEFPRFNVYFNDEYGNVLSPTQSVLSGEYAKRPDDPTIPGYTFNGRWTLDGHDYDFSTPVVEQLKIVGIVTPNEYTVTFKDGNDEVSSKTVVFGQPYGSMPTLEDSQTEDIIYTFDSWQNDQIAGKIATATTKVTIPSDHALSAVWTPAPIRIDVNPNGGSGTPQQINLYSGGMFTPSTYDFAKDGYELVGFSTDSSTSDPEYKVNESKVIYEDLVLFAVWKVTVKDIVASIKVTASGGRRLDCIVADPQEGAVVHYSINKNAWNSGNSYTATSSCSVYFKVEANGYNALGEDYTFGKKLVRTESKTDQVGPYRFDSKVNAAKYATALQAQGYIVSTSSSGTGSYFVAGYKLNVAWTITDI